MIAYYNNEKKKTLKVILISYVLYHRFRICVKSVTFPLPSITARSATFWWAKIEAHTTVLGAGCAGEVSWSLLHIEITMENQACISYKQFEPEQSNLAALPATLNRMHYNATQRTTHISLTSAFLCHFFPRINLLRFTFISELSVCLIHKRNKALVSVLCWFIEALGNL